ncbi:MAG: release factor glutamine methyltransferase [Chloroflexota bacterium]|nr:release factor glutamine methyltransferase [Chloroflexota bacterium]
MKRSGYPKPSDPRASVELGEWLAAARQALSRLADEPPSSLYALVAHILDKPAYWPQAHPEHLLKAGQVKQLDQRLNLLLAGEPLPYLLENQAFFGLDFFVNPDVLIPRPETELLVETALDWLAQHPEASRTVDVGTGSGCIAISLAKHFPRLSWTATDVSFKSLLVARRNRARHSMDANLNLVQCDLLAGLCGPFDLICANLPYIPTPTLETLEVTRHEPLGALDGGPDGLRLIDRLLAQTTSRLNPGGMILLEMEATQSESIRPIIQRHFPRAGVTIRPDLNQLPRLAIIETGNTNA